MNLLSYVRRNSENLKSFMTFKELKKQLIELKERGFITSRRKGPTGIGHTFEKEMKVKESNLAIPDLGGAGRTQNGS